MTNDKTAYLVVDCDETYQQVDETPLAEDRNVGGLGSGTVGLNEVHDVGGPFGVLDTSLAIAHEVMASDVCAERVVGRLRRVLEYATVPLEGCSIVQLSEIFISTMR